MCKKNKQTSLIVFLITVAFLLTSCSFVGATSHTGPITIYYNQDFDDGIARVNWESSWFDETPYSFNRDLAQTCAAVAAATNDSEGHTGEAQYIVPAVKDALGFQDICLYNYSKYSGSDAVKKTSNSDDCAFTFGHQRMETENGSFELVIIVCRGTETFNESVFNDLILTLSESSDGRWKPHKSYDGYISYADKVFDARNEYYKEYGDSFASEVKYLIIGHSLGGAAVQLVASRLTDQGQCIYAYTFGALNASNEPADEYGNIFNIFNYYDTYGPHGTFFTYLKPTGGASTWDNKFGKVLVFKKDYSSVLTKKVDLNTNHVMASYYHAMEDGLLDSENDVNNPSDDSDSNNSTGSFEFVGTTWKQEYGYGSWEGYNGRTITFYDDGHCSLWSPYDTYEISNVTSDGFDLSIVGLLGGNPVYTVKIIDNDTIELYLSNHQFTLKRQT